MSVVYLHDSLSVHRCYVSYFLLDAPAPAPLQTHARSTPSTQPATASAGVHMQPEKAPVATSQPARAAPPPVRQYQPSSPQAAARIQQRLDFEDPLLHPVIRSMQAEACPSDQWHTHCRVACAATQHLLRTACLLLPAVPHHNHQGSFEKRSKRSCIPLNISHARRCSGTPGPAAGITIHVCCSVSGAPGCSMRRSGRVPRSKAGLQQPQAPMLRRGTSLLPATCKQWTRTSLWCWSHRRHRS